MAAIETIFKKAMCREELKRSPTTNLGKINIEKSPGIFSLDAEHLISRRSVSVLGLKKSKDYI